MLASCGGGSSQTKNPPGLSSGATTTSSSSVSSLSMAVSSSVEPSSSSVISMSSSSQMSSSSIDSNVPLPIPTYGFNLGNTFESTWGFPSPTQAVFTNAANAGFNAIRIPCAWDFNADKTTYKINPAYMAQVKQAVDWSIAAGMHVLINIHWDGGWMENNIGNTVDPVIDEKLRSYWTQIATEFAGYDNRLLFAAANEPNAHNPAEMQTLMAYYQTFVNAVRAVGGNNTNRWLVLQGGGDTSWFTTLPSDSTPGRLMVEYHNYTPSLFTIIHTDQSWGKTIYFWGSAYQYSGDATRNFIFPAEGYTDSGFQQLKEQYVDKGIPVLIGEFQAAGKSYLTGDEAAYNRASTLYWNKYLVDSALAHGLSPFYWSTPNHPFNYETGAITDPEVVTVLTGGMAPPPPNGAPYAVSELSATTAGSGQVDLSWTAVSGATSYNLYRSAQSGYQPATPAVTGIIGTSYTDTGLNDGTTYYYQVVAVNNSGASGFSAEAYATTLGANPDPTKFHFETDTHRWSVSGAQIATSTEQHYAGQRSLSVSFNSAPAGTAVVDVNDIVVPAGATVTFRVWVPAGNQVTQIQPYLQDYNWAWTNSSYTNLAADAWNELTITVPSGATAPLKRLGLRITTGDAWTGTLYIDSVDWGVQSVPTGL
ncbi:MAG: cellulase family glycosylhydrolase [Cellvibrio sp.]|uniref:cellulase family glycosylhydrolase n=1 Tax=Cellvibrio sp. TaxID=1965322 RepID=UPI0027279785|nr:cellulase family glycosylhydrolase [Cellvibrio sp.]